MTKPRLAALPARIGSVDPRRLQPMPKVVDNHYHTPEHRAWRAAVIRRAGGQCQAAGCGRGGVRLFADHVVELKDGGAPFDLGNGQALCGACHSRKTLAARADRMRR